MQKLNHKNFFSEIWNLKSEISEKILLNFARNWIKQANIRHCGLVVSAHRLGRYRNRLWVWFLAVIGYISHVHRAYDYLKSLRGSLGSIWLDTQKLCWKKQMLTWMEASELLWLHLEVSTREVPLMGNNLWSCCMKQRDFRAPSTRIPPGKKQIY